MKKSLEYRTIFSEIAEKKKMQFIYFIVQTFVKETE